MREIKFRAWFGEENKMIPFDELHIELENGEYTVYYSLDGDSVQDGLCVEDFNIMQYTGLKDRNSKEIYEGDIVIYKPNYRAFLAVDEIRNEIKNGAIVWNEHGFWAIDDNYPSNEYYASYPIPMLCGGLEVVGNIYENPELLEWCK